MSSRALALGKPKRLGIEFWVLLVAFAAIAFGFRGELERDPGLAMNEQRGYRAAADALVDGDCLKLNSISETVRRKSIDYKGGEGCPSQAVFNRYRSLSPLGADMARLVDRRWRISRGVDGESLLAIRGNSHPLRFSASERLRWTGSVYFAEGREAGMPSGSVWVSGEDIRNTAPDCAGKLVDGREPAAAPALGQYVQCDGRAWQRVERIQALSEETGSARRVRYPQLASVLRRLEVSRASGNFDSTIQRRLQLAMQDRLEKHLAKADSSRKSEPTIRAGVLLMDGLTGEIAAAATYPAKEEHAKDDRGRNWLDRNWNFERLPVGSTAKVPIAAAIIQGNPDLDGRSPGNPNLSYCGTTGNVRTVCRRRAMQTLGTTFEQFIKVSSNGHALWLMDRAYHEGSEEWYDHLRRFACIEPLDGDGDPSCSGYLWRSDKIDAGMQDRGLPEPLLRLDMDNLRGEVEYTARQLSILGGNRSTWTSANLGQAYARILSDRAMNPRLTPKDGPSPERLGMDLEVWKKVRNGMAAVLSGGTGSKLCGAIGCSGYRYGNTFLYGKTGTPTVAEARGNRPMEDGKVFVLLAARTANNQPPQTPSDITDLKVVVLTQRFYAKGTGTESLDLAADLFDDPLFLKWLGERKR
ncbi:MAG: penicillin-binding transpeptidase domain-containing protein [Pseudomonadota bacterium]